MKIDIRSEKPIFIQLSEWLEDAILSEAFEEETQIPSTTSISAASPRCWQASSRHPPRMTFGRAFDLIAIDKAELLYYCIIGNDDAVGRSETDCCDTADSSQRMAQARIDYTDNSTRE